MGKKNKQSQPEAEVDYNRFNIEKVLRKAEKAKKNTDDETNTPVEVKGKKKKKKKDKGNKQHHEKPESDIMLKMVGDIRKTREREAEEEAARNGRIIINFGENL